MERLYKELMKVNEQKQDDIAGIVRGWVEELREGKITEKEFLKYVIEDVLNGGFSIEQLLEYLD
ncbi:MAG: hypothetical protein ACTSUO_08435 [Candidatus Thorarchaeota archaeon]